LLRAAKAEFDVESKKTPYFSLLPADVKPDIETNRAEMEKHRPAMRRLYLNKTPRFN
jgi:aminobenzoyl-glutamate utilization protein B